jgi:copper homeostasis protein
MKNYTLEIAVFGLDGALKAQHAGAHRIEFCANQPEGGTTPSAGIMQQAAAMLHIPFFPIIRPRGGHFVYAAYEIETMAKDVRLAKDLGCEGVVIGFLTADNQVDRALTSRFVELAYPMDVTFHRAFDSVPDQLEALETLIDAGCTRILTSGAKSTAVEGIEQIARLIDAADDRIIIMPGGGVRSSNLEELAQKTGAREFHNSARILTGLQGTAEEYSSWYTVDEQEVQDCLSRMSTFSAS